MRSWVILVLVAALIVEVRVAFLIDHDVPTEPHPMAQMIALAGLEQGDVTIGDQLAARAKVIEEARARAAQSAMPDLGIRMVRGVVVKDGQPALGAAVSLEMRTVSDGINLDGYPPLPWPANPWRTQTDGRGYFEFKRLPKSDFVVRAWESGRLALAGVSFDDAHLVWDGILSLEPAQPLGGSLVDAGGMPIPDALVFPLAEGATTPAAPAYWLSFLPETTDASGRFLFTLAPGTCRFIVNAPGYGTWVTRPFAAGTTAEIVAEAGGGISGVLSRAQDKQPAANLAVRLEAVTYPLMARRAKTDLNGEFDFANLPAGDYRIALDTDRFAFASGTASVEVHTGTSASRQTLDVIRTQSARGRVVDETGAGVSGLTVVARGGGAIQAKTDFAGYYRLTRLVPGEYQVVLRGAAGLIVEAVPGTALTVREGEDAAGPNFVVRPGAGKGRVIFQVTDVSGRPVENAAIFYLAAPGGVVVPGADAMAGAVIADAEGRYVWEGVPRDWEFRAYASTGVMVSPLLESARLGDKAEASVTLTLSDKAVERLPSILAALRP